MLRAVALVATLNTAFALSACATPTQNGSPQPQPRATGVTAPSVSAASPSLATPRGFVSEATWTDGTWPLTVPEGTLACESLGRGLGRVTITVGGKTYWVNGTAKGTHRYADLEEIWRADPSYPAIKVNIGPLLDRGLALC